LITHPFTYSDIESILKIYSDEDQTSSVRLAANALNIIQTIILSEAVSVELKVRLDFVTVHPRVELLEVFHGVTQFVAH
jgi:hypothetical protein